MECFTIRFVDDADQKCCPKFGKCTPLIAGWLFTEEQDAPVCRSCGKKLAPSMVALLDLATAAERVGKSCRHLLTPPMSSLLDLAHAAENYTHTAPVGVS